MKRCLVLGGNGFLGSHLAEGLVEKGYDVSVFDSFQTGMANLETVRGRVEVMEGESQSPHGQQGVIAMFLNKIKMGERPALLPGPHGGSSGRRYGARLSVPRSMGGDRPAGKGELC